MLNGVHGPLQWRDLQIGPSQQGPLICINSDSCKRKAMSALGHVWTAPCSDVAAALAGCRPVSGLLMRRIKLLALMLCANRFQS